MFGRESFREFLSRESETTRALVRTNHEEVLRFHEKSEQRRKESEERWEAIKREDRERYERALEETREFNREILLRNEKVYTAAIAEMEEGRRQIRANTEAVLRLLDRFDQPGDAAA